MGIDKLQTAEAVLKMHIRQAYVHGIQDLAEELCGYSTGVSALSEDKVREWIDEQKKKVFE